MSISEDQNNIILSSVFADFIDGGGGDVAKWFDSVPYEMSMK